MSVSRCFRGPTYDAGWSNRCIISHTGHRGVQAARVLAWPIFRGGNRYTLDIADKTVSYLPFKLPNKISGGSGPSSSGYRNALLPFRHGIGVELFLLSSAVKVTA